MWLCWCAMVTHFKQVVCGSNLQQNKDLFNRSLFTKQKLMYTVAILRFSHKICCQVMPSWQTWRNFILVSFWFLCMFFGFVLVFVWLVFLFLIFIPNIPGLMICLRCSSYQSKLLVLSTHPKSSSLSNQKSQQAGR